MHALWSRDGCLWGWAGLAHGGWGGVLTGAEQNPVAAGKKRWAGERRGQQHRVPVPNSKVTGKVDLSK